jgi:hypothetical protein
MGVFNANPTARGLVTGVTDGWLAHGKQRADGSWSFPNEINWRTDAERVGDGGGLNTPLQSAWASYRFTGNEKYLRPLLGRVASNGPGAIAEMNENLIDVLNHRKDWGADFVARAGKSNSEFGRYAAWQASGDKYWIEALHADAIREKSLRMYMFTEGHWWSDRVEQPNEILQRERLGGIALKRNWTYPGNTVSWRFERPEAAEQVAILMPGATLDHFKVIAYNTSDQAQRAAMSTWNVTAGEWKFSSGLDINGDDTADSAMTTGHAKLQRSGAVDVTFAPHATTVLEFTLETPSTPAETRADLGIGVDDIHVHGGNIEVTVHSLGGTATLEDANGKVLARAAIPALAAPRDLTPKTAQVHLTLPAHVATEYVRVHVSLPNSAEEVTDLNNTVRLAEVAHTSK